MNLGPWRGRGEERIFGRGPLADWPAGAVIAALCAVALVFVLYIDLLSRSVITVGGLGVIAILAAAFLLSQRLLIAVVTVAVLLRGVSVLLGGVNPASAAVQTAAYLFVASLTYLAADSMRAARKSADRVDRLRNVLSAAIDVAGASPSPMDWVQKLMVFSVQAVGADRGSVSRFEGDEMVVEASFDRSEKPLDVGSRWKIEEQPLAVDLRAGKRSVQGTPALPASLPPDDAVGAGRIRHSLLIPLIYEDTVHGMIALAIYHDPAFAPEAVESVEQVARLASLALRSSRLYADLNRARLEAESVSASLARRERQLEEAQMMAHVGSWELDLLNEEITWSAEIYRIYGLDPSPGRLQAADMLRSVHPDDRDKIRQVIDTVRRSGTAFSVEYRIVRPDGQTRTLHSRGRPVVDEAQKPVAVAGTAQDITELKRAEQELVAVAQEREQHLRRVAERGEALERAKSEFLMIASHELRGPLSVLNGYLSLMKDGTLGELPQETSKVLPTLTAQCGAMNALIDEMLNTARLEQTTELDAERLDLCAVVREAVTEQVRLKAAGDRLNVELPDRPVTVLADRAKLLIILSILVDNALKYSGPRNAVRCTVTVEPQSAVVTVRDWGPGIREEDMPKLFTRFGRIVSADNAHIYGAGLGLYQAQTYANMHGGKITVDSAPGQGSSFALRIPLALDPESAIRKAAFSAA